MYTILQNIAGCRAKKINLCCITGYAYSKNKFVILNEIFFLTDLHLSKIVHIILDMSYEQFSYQAEQKSWTFNEQFT